MSLLVNRARMTTATTGTGTITLGLSLAGYLSFNEAGVPHNGVVTYCLEDGTSFEIGRGVYNSSALTLTRGAIIVSKINGQAADTSPISLSGSAIVYLTAAAEDLLSRNVAIDDNAVVRGDGGAGGVQSSGVTIDDSGNVAGLGFLDVGEIAAPASPASNVARLFARDVASRTEVAFKRSDGTVVDLLRGFVSVKDFAAVGDGVADDRNAFEAAAAASNGVVLVPRGTYLIGSATSTRVAWLLIDATITGLSALGDGQTPTVTVDNTSRLSGTVIKLQDLQYGNAMHVGDPDPWMEQFIRPSAQSRATLVAMSPDGQIGLTAATKTGDNPGTAGTQLAGVAGNFYAVNDYVGDRVGYGGYFEGWRRPGAGQTLAFEADVVNEDATVPFNPGSPLSPSSAYTFGALINSGGGRSGTHTLFPASAALAFGANGSTFERGIVFNSGVLSGSEAISVPITYQMAWYAGTTKTSYLDQATHQRLVQDNSVSAVDSNKRHRASGAATQNLDVIFQETAFGCSGSSTDYQAAFTRVLQRSNFSGGNARFSYDITVRNTDGTESQVTLNGSANKSFAPATNNDIALGDASFRWSTGYFVSLNTSGVITENGINHWTPVRKTADQTKTSTTALANDTTLQFAMAANTKYAFRCKIHYSTPGGADIKFRHAGPASPSFVHIRRNSIAPGAVALGNIAVDTAYSAADIVITETSGTEGFFEFEGVVHNGANSGTFAIQWAQNTSDAGSTIVRAGSYLEYAIT
jgi:hypothetical protein